MAIPLKNLDYERANQEETLVKILSAQVEREKYFSNFREAIAILSHQIRNPLGSISIYSNLILRKEKDEKCLKFAKQIYDQTKKMDEEIQTLIHCTNFPKLNIYPVNLYEVIERSLDFLISLGNFDFFKDFEIPNALKTQQVLGNKEILEQLTIQTFSQLEAPKKQQIKIKAWQYKEYIALNLSPFGTRKNEEKPFHPFFGSLAKCHNFCQSLNGAIDLNNNNQMDKQLILLLPRKVN